MAIGAMCFGSGDKKGNDPDTLRNAEVEKELRAHKKQLEKEIKILLLGAGESGKSTVLKQMRMIHAGGFTHRDRVQWRSVIFQNMITAFQQMLITMEDHGIAFENPQNRANVEPVNTDPEIDINRPLPSEFLAIFKSLWADNAIRQAISRGNEYALQDNLTYFFNDIDRLFDQDYIPTDQDILRARLRTVGITEEVFNLGNFTYKMFDVGGQRSERRKWIHVFDGVNVVLFLAAISGYDHVLYEDRSQNQTVEALNLFEAIANSPWFVKSAIILFLNKIDLFREKVQSGQVSISQYFPQYTGGSTDVKAGQEFFAEEFKRKLKTPGKEVYVHFTNATDTDLLKKTMQSVQDMIVQRNLNELIL